MIPDATFEPAAASKLRLRFSLLALLFFITLVSVLLAWWVQPRRVVATALFQVSSQPVLFGNDSFDQFPQDHDFETFKQTQLALLKEEYVLSAAARDPAVASLAILEGRDHVAWLQDRLEVEFLGNSEILAIRLRGPEEYSAELVQLVNAVSKAYSEQVASAEQTRHSLRRDLLRRSLVNLNKKISSKWDELLKIAGALDLSTSELGLLQQGEASQTAGVRVGAPRTDGEPLGVIVDDSQATSRTLENALALVRSENRTGEPGSSDRGWRVTKLMSECREIGQLQRLADELTYKMERMDIEFEINPPRIRQLQPAIARPE